MKQIWFIVFMISSAYTIDEEKILNREGKVLPIFQVVRFPNDVCSGTTRNGTCFTAEECSNIGGTNEGSCASGFGVCCISALSCGGTSSTNNSYIVQTGVTKLTSPCTYKICPCSTDICRIRYDFTINLLAPQILGSVDGTGTLTDNSIVGDCRTDSMSITSPGLFGTPVICGTNTGQHMILDSSGTQCQDVNFYIGASTGTTRQWDIYVTQYTCGQETIAGPPGCLQYFTGVSGTFKNFGFDTTTNTNAATAVTTTHLQNQRYEICMRREKGYCHICYTPFSAGAGQGSFGLSITAAGDVATVIANHDTQCTTDYIVIPQGTSSTSAASTAVVTANHRFCGRYLNTAGGTANASICSRNYPFRVSVNTDDTEFCDTEEMTQKCESDTAPGGIIGFALNYVQSAC